jgi:beta-galactosidase
VTAPSAGPGAAGNGTPQIVVSAWYGGGRTRATMVRPPEPGDQERWRRDLETMRDSGLDAFRCWADWAAGEPARGKYDFRNLDLLADLAEQTGLGFYVQVYLDSAPDWVGHDYPDGRYVAASGDAIDSQGSPGYCYDHPGVRERAGLFLGELAGRLAGRAAFRGWDLWSEPHVVQWSYFDFLTEPAMFCYCPHTVARFQDWLRGRYGGIDELNAAWYRGFTSFGEVTPPRFTTLMTSVPVLDWQHFLMDKLAADLRWRHDEVRRADSHVTSSHSAVPCLLTLPTSAHGSPDDWHMPASVDVYGTSLYPKHVGARETAAPAFRSALLACTRSASGDAPFWLGELQGGHGYVGTFAAPVTGEDVRAYAWQCIAHGAKGLHFYAWYPMTTGIESGGFGLANLDGSANDRTHAAGQVASIVRAHQDVLGPARPVPSEVAICWDVHANALWAAMRESWHYVPSRSYVGAYRALYGERILADYVHTDQIEAGLPARHRVLYLPFALALTPAAAASAAEFAARGGVLLAEARTGWTDEAGRSGQAIPALGLDELFGARERDCERTAEDEPVPIRVVRDHPLLPGLSSGDVINGTLFRQRLEARDAEVLAVFADGSPAITARRVPGAGDGAGETGGGWAVLAGSLLSLSVHRLGDDGARRFLAGLAHAAGVRPPVEVAGAGADVEPHLLASPGGEMVLIAFNHGQQEAAARFTFGWPRAGAQVLDLTSGEPVPGVLADGQHATIPRTLAPGELFAARIAPAD